MMKVKTLGVLSLVLLLAAALCVVAVANASSSSRLPLTVAAPADALSASLVVSPTAGMSGVLFRVSAQGLNPGEPIALTIAGPDDQRTISNATGSADGTLAAFWDSSHQLEGTYRLSLASSSGLDMAASWSVTPGQLCTERDGFDAATLEPGWWWQREDPASWSLTAEPGALRIHTQMGSLGGAANDQRNVLLHAAPSGDFRLTAQVKIAADQDYQNAGIYLYEDDDHYLRLVRGMASKSVGPGIYFDIEAGSAYTGTHVAANLGLVWLKLDVKNDVYSAFFSRDGVVWSAVGKRQISAWRPTQLGLAASNGSAQYASEIPADFEWLRVDQFCTRLELPMVVKELSPRGHLVINEVMPEAAGGGYEWVELLNDGAAPLDLDGYRVTDEDEHVYVIPAELPQLPPDGLVLIQLDGAGAAADDYDLSDKVAVLHSPAGLVSILEDAADQVAIYRAMPHGPETIAAFLAYGEPAGADGADAAQARLWGLAWFVPRAVGSGVQPEGITLPGYSVGLFPGGRAVVPGRYALYTPGTSSPGAPNGVPALPWYDPPDGTVVDAATLGVSWQSLRQADGYRFQLDETDRFDSPSVDETVTHPWWRTTTPLLPGTYYWRVQAQGEDGRTGPWLQPVRIVAQAVGVASAAGGAALLQEKVLGVEWLIQGKDTSLLCLDGDDAHPGAPDPWDAPHPTYYRQVHGTYNCVRASATMINHYMGGNISQDYLAYKELENFGEPFRPSMVELGYTGQPQLDLAHNFPSGPGSNEMVAWAWGIPAGTLEQYQGKAAFSWIRERIDADRPIMRFAGTHAIVIAGYRVAGDGVQWLYTIDPWSPPPAGAEGTWVTYDSLPMDVLSVAPVESFDVPSDPADFTTDSDSDGIMNFDEEYRFHTSSTNPDTDGDGVDDKTEIMSYVFDEPGTWSDTRPADYDGDGLRAETDFDNDGDGINDGCEDANRDGWYQPSQAETSNFDAAERQRCAGLSVDPSTMSFSAWDVVETLRIANLGDGGFTWEIRNLPEGLRADAESGFVSDTPIEIDIVAELSVLGSGETGFQLWTEHYGTAQVVVQVDADVSGPDVVMLSPDQDPDRDRVYEEGCPGTHTFLVRARVTDDEHEVGSVWTRIEDFADTGSDFPMEHIVSGGQDSYQVEISGLAAGSYVYQVQARDTVNNRNWGEQRYLQISECHPPTFSTPVLDPPAARAYPCDGHSLMVWVQITDESAIRDATLHWDIPSPTGRSQGQSGMMWLPVEHGYYASLPELSVPGTAGYWFTAEDEGRTSATSPQYTLEILSCSGPTFGHPGSVDVVRVPPCQPDQATLTIDWITDPAGQVDAEVFMRPPTDEDWQGPFDMQYVDSRKRWETPVGPFKEPGRWFWKITATNQIGGVAETPAMEFIVDACDTKPPVITEATANPTRVYLAPCAPDETRIQVAVGWDAPPDEVRLEWHYRGQADITIVPLKWVPDVQKYRGVLGGFSSAGTVESRIVAVDSVGRQDSTVEAELTVAVCQSGPQIGDIQASEAFIRPAPCTPDHLHVQARIGAMPGLEIASATLRATRASTAETTDAPMTLVQGHADLYEGTISGLTEPDVYHYGVVATDSGGRTTTSESSAFTVEACNVAAPQIVDVHVAETALFEAPCEPNGSFVTARITDALGVSVANLSYRSKAPTEAPWRTVPMTQQGDEWRGAMTDLTAGGWIYTIQAINAANVEKWSPPDDFVVSRCVAQGPRITLGDSVPLLVLPPCRPGRAKVQAQITDVAGVTVEGASLVYRLGGALLQTKPMQEDENGVWYAVLSGFELPGVGTYFVTARNSAGGRSSTGELEFRVRDCHLPSVGVPSESADPIHMPPCAPSEITISADLTDPDGISGAWVVFAQAGEEDAQRRVVAMEQQAGSDRWLGTLGPFEGAGTFGYVVVARNTLGGLARSPAATFQVTPCESLQVGELWGSAGQIFLAPCQPNKLQVSAKVTPAEAVEKAWIGYRNAVVRDDPWHFAVMTPTVQDGWWEGWIGPFPSPLAVEYRVVALAKNGSAAATESAQAVVAGCSQPVVAEVKVTPAQVSLPPCSPSTAVISAKVTAVDGIDSVVLRYRNRKETKWTEEAMIPGATVGSYHVTVGPFDQDGNVDYAIVATSKAGAVTSSDLATLVVGKCSAPHESVH